jgi:hypothetical protein
MTNNPAGNIPALPCNTGAHHQHTKQAGTPGVSPASPDRNTKDAVTTDEPAPAS